ncbi:MAG: redox-regulated ATPase YchF, partial [Bacteroidia bacterium]|nr:redox-regulated ATPase YchF [Bacteroidia bacterium]
IAGLVKGASQGEGLGNKFLSHIRQVNAVAHVVRCFEDPNVVHVDGRVDPVADMEIIDTELQLKDLETIETRMAKLAKQVKTGDKTSKKLLDLLTEYKEHLGQGKNIRTLNSDEDKQAMVKEMGLLTEKPVLYVCNVDPESVNDGNEFVEKVKEAVAGENAEILIISAAIESEIAELEDAADRKEFLAEMGLEKSGVEKLIMSSYSLLNYITYFTVGVKEVRAWTITEGTKGPQAAAAIHTDFEKGFIRAEVIAYNDFIEYKSEAACRNVGKLKVEGKEYVVSDGDCMHFLFNV